MSKVTPVEDSELSVKDMSLGEFMQKISKLDKPFDKNVTIEENSVASIDQSSIPETCKYVEPDDQEESSGTYIITRKGGYIEH